MTPALARAQLLLQQSRFDLAEQELRRALAEAPHDPRAHAMLAMALVYRDQFDEAQAAAEQAIALAPDWAYAHFCRSVVLQGRRRFAEAEASAREAVHLDPEDADHHAQLAATLYSQGHWQNALDAALEGLARDADHAQCSHMRAMALTKLNRQHEAIASVDQALARNPDDASAHANKGWALLHQGKSRPALDHFREALRLNPNDEYARAGMVEALKANHFLYRWMLAYFLWMSRLSNRARWGVVLGAYFGYRLLGNLAEQEPELAKFIWPILILYMIFVALAWFASPLFNLLLLLSRFGRHALSADQKSGAKWFAACLVVALTGAASLFFLAEDTAITLIVFGVGMAIPFTTIYRLQSGWPRRAMAWYAAALAAVGLACLVAIVNGYPWFSTAFDVFLLGSVFTTWIANGLVSVTPTR